MHFQKAMKNTTGLYSSGMNENERCAYFQNFLKTEMKSAAFPSFNLEN